MTDLAGRDPSSPRGPAEPGAPAAPADRASPASLLSDQDLYLFNEGTHFRLHDHLGCHPVAGGSHFAVWAPNAASVAVVGDWNGWQRAADPLAARGRSGIWEGFVRGVASGARYKYHIVSRYAGYRVDKADPFAIRAEVPPATASVVWDGGGYEWRDQEWMDGRAARQALGAPIAIYELHLGSFRRKPEEGNRPLSYREIAPWLAAHVKRLGFTHVELMPLAEHPFYGSWGYQATGYFAPTSRYGTPQDLMALVDHLHGEGIGVILDWVPSHFPSDEHGLGFFDGTHLFEHADPRQGIQPDWGSLVFNYGRREVWSFLISNAAYWLERYHLDGLRVDAVASMLYLDYSRREGEWVPNRFGGRENLEAIEFLRAFNTEVYASFPGVQTFAEESTAWPMVSRPSWLGGLGFGLKWDMGWMHDSLDYLAKDPVHRRFHHNKLTFRGLYAWTESFVLPLSHDEVVHGKGSLLAKMPGDEWQKLANLRLLYGWMVAQPGKKLLFMGSELAPWGEWNHEASLDWHLLERPPHAGICRWLEDLNRLYRAEAALHRLDCQPEGFAWIDAADSDHSVYSFERRGQAGDPPVVAVFNFTPLARTNYRIGVPSGGFWRELLNSDSPDYGGGGQGNFGGVEASPVPLHGRPWSLTLTLPPLAALFLRSGHGQGGGEPSGEAPAELGAAQPAGGATGG